MKLLKWGKNIKIKILIWHMLGEMVKKWDRARYYLFCNYSCTLHFLVKISLDNLMKLPTSACLNLKYGTSKQKLKMFKTLILVIFSVKLNILPNHDGIYRFEKNFNKYLERDKSVRSP